MKAQLMPPIYLPPGLEAEAELARLLFPVWHAPFSSCSMIQATDSSTVHQRDFYSCPHGLILDHDNGLNLGWTQINYRREMTDSTHQPGLRPNQPGGTGLSSYQGSPLTKSSHQDQ